MAHSDIIRQSLLELPDLRTHDVIAMVEHCCDVRFNFASDTFLLDCQVDEMHIFIRCVLSTVNCETRLAHQLD